jgi:hypothetical protein
MPLTKVTYSMIEGAPFNVLAYGAIGDGVTDNTTAIQSAINAAIATNAPAYIEFPAGVYKVSNSNLPGYTAYDNRVAMLLDGASDLSLIGNQTTILFSGTNRNNYAHSLLLNNCKNILIKNLNFDWENLPYVQGVCLSKTSTTVDFTIDTNVSTPTFSDIQRVEQYDPSTALWLGVVWNRPSGGGDTPGRSLTQVSGNTYRLTANIGDATTDFVIGATYVLTHQVYGAQAIQIQKSEYCNVEDVTVYAAAGMSIRSNDSTTLNFNANTVLIKPNSDRLISTTADGFHFSSCRGDINLYSCQINNTGDDGVHVGSPLLTVNTVLNTTTFTANTAYPFTAPRLGDVLKVINADGSSTDLGTIANISGTSNPYSIVVSQTLPMSFASSAKVQNISAVGTPEINGCNFNGIRGQAVLAMMQNGRIINNSARNIAGGGFVCWSYPSYFGDGITPSKFDISNNLTENCPRVVAVPAAIQVFARDLADTADAPAGTIVGVTINNNVIRKSKNMGIYVVGLADSSVCFNSVYECNLDPDAFWNGYALNGYAIGGRELENVVLQGNIGNGDTTLKGIVGGTLTNITSDLNYNFPIEGSLPAYFVRSWVAFSASGGIVTVSKAGNVLSVVRNSAGIFTITFNQPMLTAYAINGTCFYTGQQLIVSVASVNANSYQIYTATSAGVATDPDGCYLTVFA